MGGRRRKGVEIIGIDWKSDPRFAAFVERFNRRRFFEAHEVLEELWLEFEGDDREFLQGLIQLAVALEHQARSNPAGAWKVLRSAGRRLARYGAHHGGMAIGSLQERVERYLTGKGSAPPTLRAAADPPAGARAGAHGRAKTTRTDETGDHVVNRRSRPGGRRAGSRVGKGRENPRVRPVLAAERSLGERTAKPNREERPRPAAPLSQPKDAEGTRRAVRSPSKRPAPGKRKAPGRAATDRRAPGRPAASRLERLEVRRARALGILEGLRRLYPDAQCELRHGSALELLVATILSAQCTDVRVNMTTPALFARYRTAADYAAADQAKLGETIRSTGFYQNKSRSIIGLGRALVERHGGKVPDTMEDLVQLPGVGRKTANVLLAEWFGRPGIAVDTHVIRLTGPIWRLTNETDPVKIEFALYELVPEKDRAFFGIATIFHGRRVCSARKPDCARCLLNSICPSAFAPLAARKSQGRPPRTA